jgi:hypothetical protein
MNSKNHCDDFGQKRRFCYLDMTKTLIFDRFSSISSKVRVSEKCEIDNFCYRKGLFADKLY